MNIRTTPEEDKKYKEMAALFGLSLSSYVRETLNRSIEDFEDIREAEKVLKEHEKNPVTLSHDEFWEGLV